MYNTKLLLEKGNFQIAQSGFLKVDMSFKFAVISLILCSMSGCVELMNRTAN